MVVVHGWNDLVLVPLEEAGGELPAGPTAPAGRRRCRPWRPTGRARSSSSSPGWVSRSWRPGPARAPGSRSSATSAWVSPWPGGPGPDPDRGGAGSIRHCGRARRGGGPGRPRRAATSTVRPRETRGRRTRRPLRRRTTVRTDGRADAGGGPPAQAVSDRRRPCRIVLTPYMCRPARPPGRRPRPRGVPWQRRGSPRGGPRPGGVRNGTAPAASIAGRTHTAPCAAALRHRTTDSSPPWRAKTSSGATTSRSRSATARSSSTRRGLVVELVRPTGR